MLTSGSTVVFEAANFTAASDTLFKVRVLTGMKCFSLLGAWFVTTSTGCDELAIASTVTLQFLNSSLQLWKVW
jgi:hypothetical protein